MVVVVIVDYKVVISLLSAATELLIPAHQHIKIMRVSAFFLVMSVVCA